MAWRLSSELRCLAHEVLLPLLHLAVTAAKLCRPGGVRAVIAENLLLKQQLIVLRRSRQRAPNLRVGDRVGGEFVRIRSIVRSSCRGSRNHPRSSRDGVREMCC